MGSHMQKWPMINFYAISPHRKYTRQTQENLSRRGVHAIYCCKKAKQQRICLVQPQKHSCLKSVPKHEWKRSSHTQSVSVFRRGVTALSSQILFLCFIGFCFPSGHETFSVLNGHLFPIFGAVTLPHIRQQNNCSLSDKI